MRAHLIQLDIAWEAPSTNRERVSRLLEQARPGPGDLVVLPEMFDTGFSFRLGATVDHEGETLAFLTQLARRWGVTVHGSRTVSGESGRGRNVSSVVGPDGSLLCEYNKQRPFELGPVGARECDCFEAGTSPGLYTWVRPGAPESERSVRVGCLICYDLRFPELFRAALARGAEVFVVPANWPRTRVEHWRALLIARAIENQAYVLGVNRVGRDPSLDYPGVSLAIDPTGRVLAEGDDREGVLSVEIARGPLDDWRARFPAWKNV